MDFTWQWWVSQVLMGVALVFVIIQMQQKTAKRLLWYRMLATSIALVGAIFLGVFPVIVIMIAGIVRLSAALFFAYRPNTKIFYKWIAGALIAALIITLNIVFWESYLNILSIIFGIGMVAMYLQKNATRIRVMSICVTTFGIVFYSLSMSPMNIATEAFCLANAIVGIIRLDIKRRKPARAKIIESPAGTGKTTLGKRSNVLDMDSNTYKSYWDEHYAMPAKDRPKKIPKEQRVPNPDWWNLYRAEIVRQSANFDLILVGISTDVHADVDGFKQWLEANNLEYITAIPEISDMEEYLDSLAIRMRERGSSDSGIAWVRERFPTWIAAMKEMPFQKVQIKENEFLEHALVREGIISNS